MLANGIWEANGANNNKVASTNILWKTPENGLTAPLFILVALRAIARVAGIPPKRGVTIFAIPCPISSRSELCLLPVIPSETTADSRDSIPPNIAITNAGCQSIKIFSQVIWGYLNVGNDCGMPPNADQIVATLLVQKMTAATVGLMRATSKTGTLGKNLGIKITIKRPITAVSTLNMFMESKF